MAQSLWPGLIATFNSGFKLDASRGGWFLDGRAATPLRDGAASVVIFRSGSATVGQWGRDATLTADVVAVRQNLNLLVDTGQPAPGLGTNILPAWGFTLGGAVATWRSALGVDGAGRLLYIAGPGLDPANLASAAIAAGAIRAMELDINPAFVLFSTFADGPTRPGGPSGPSWCRPWSPRPPGSSPRWRGTSSPCSPASAGHSQGEDGTQLVGHGRLQL